jgi:hypothetical protein
VSIHPGAEGDGPPNDCGCCSDPSDELRNVWKLISDGVITAEYRFGGMYPVIPAPSELLVNGGWGGDTLFGDTAGFTYPLYPYCDSGWGMCCWEKLELGSVGNGPGALERSILGGGKYWSCWFACGCCCCCAHHVESALLGLLWWGVMPGACQFRFSLDGTAGGCRGFLIRASIVCTSKRGTGAI